jgi:hypothetical protein
MLAGIQLLGIVFSLIMIYLAYIYYKRKNYGIKSFLIWLGVWAGALFLMSFPKTFYGIMEVLQIDRTADFIVLLGFTFFSVIIFYLYTLVKKNNYKIEQLVRQLAMDELEKKGKKQKLKERKK